MLVRFSYDRVKYYNWRGGNQGVRRPFWGILKEFQFSCRLDSTGWHNMKWNTNVADVRLTSGGGR